MTEKPASPKRKSSITEAAAKPTLDRAFKPYPKPPKATDESTSTPRPAAKATAAPPNAATKAATTPAVKPAATVRGASPARATTGKPQPKAAATKPARPAQPPRKAKHKHSQTTGAPLWWRVLRMVPIAFFSVARMLIGVFLRLRWQAKVVVSTLLFVGVVVITLMLSQAAQERVIAAFFAPSVQYWARDIRRWSVQYEVDPNLIATVMQIESCGLPSAESISRAQGLFQVMPFHFPDEEKASMTDPEINAKRGMGVLKDCLARANGDAGLAMACYNGGPSVLLRGNWPNETTRYYYWGTGIYADASSGSRSSGRLTEWLEAGGLSLCQQASAALGVPAASLSTPANEQPSYSSGTLPDAPSVLPTFDSTRR